MSLSRVYANPQHRRSRSVSTLDLPRSFSSSSSSSSCRSSYAESVEGLVYTERAAIRSYGKRIATAWHGTIISVDYAIITRPTVAAILRLSHVCEKDSPSRPRRVTRDLFLREARGA